MTQSIFFESIKELDIYCLQLGQSILDVFCSHCQSFEEWVSHGFVYKKDYGGNKIQVGKRVLCSNRGQKQGCGRTLRLYLADRTPRLHYSVNALFIFASLIGSINISHAYQRATSCASSRNAYRWLDKLTATISRYRVQLSQLSNHDNLAAFRSTAASKRLSVIHETFSGLTEQFLNGEHYQLQTQQSLVAP